MYCKIDIVSHQRAFYIISIVYYHSIVRILSFYTVFFYIILFFSSNITITIYHSHIRMSSKILSFFSFLIFKFEIIK